MILTDAGGRLLRQADVDVSDLTTAVPTGSPWWHADGTTLEIPFATEPTEAEQRLIRRRLTTETPADEARITRYVDNLDQLEGQSGPLIDLVRDLVGELITGIDRPASTSNPAQTPTDLLKGPRP